MGGFTPGAAPVIAVSADGTLAAIHEAARITLVELPGAVAFVEIGIDPEVVEEWKWRGVPVWSHDGIICTGETYKSVVKMTFAKGASLEDPSGLFNSSLEGNTRRAIDFHEGDKINEKALKALIRAAVVLNGSKRATARPVRSPKRPKSA